MRRVVALVAVVSALLVGLSVATAQADPAECAKRDEQTGQCLIFVMPPPPEYPPPGGGGPGDPPGGGDPGDPVCYDPIRGDDVACVIDDWYWSTTWACHTRLSDPQPAYGEDPWPPGETDGAIYDCARGMTLGDPLPDEVILRWSPVPPWGSPPDPEDLAREAVEAMNLSAIELGIVPEDRPGSIGLIGLPSWMWAEDPAPNTWGPITRTASSGPYSVTATAKVEQVEWDMGDDTVVACTEPGTPYHEGYGDQESPDCGHKYASQGTYEVSATSYWVVEWSGMGQSGTIELDLTNSTSISMGEAQAIVTNN